jgi:hypothetical protein
MKLNKIEIAGICFLVVSFLNFIATMLAQQNILIAIQYAQNSLESGTINYMENMITHWQTTSFLTFTGAFMFLFVGIAALAFGAYKHTSWINADEQTKGG